MSVSVVQMLENNLRDRHARHLMLVCRGEVDVALTLVRRAAEKEHRNLQIMMGSTFTEDQSDHYSFGLLRRVVLSMERGDLLVMRALEAIHGSLYDMLNMSYTTLGNKRHCRIALGDTDIFAQVHENFRCVVLQDADQLHLADAAFLNRFEKHYVSISDMVTSQVHREAVKQLEGQAARATSGPRLNDKPEVQSLFAGWGPETSASLINYVAASSSETLLPGQLVAKAWHQLLPCASVDGMLRATELSHWAQDLSVEPNDVKDWREQFFAQPQSLPDWLVANGWQAAPGEAAIRYGVVLTTSPLQIDLKQILHDTVPAFQCVAVDALTSELDLSQKLEDFNDAQLPPGAVLVLQLRADSPHVELLKHRCAELRENRRALLLLHGSRRLMRSSALRVGLSFQRGWKQVFLERLTKETVLDVHQCVKMELQDFLKDDGPMPFEAVLKSVLSECFWYIKYPPTQAAALHVKEVTELVLKDKDLLALLRRICMDKLNAWQSQGQVWWHKVLKDMQRQAGHASFADCIEAFVRQAVRGPAAVFLYLLEKSCALKTLSFYPDDSALRRSWFQLCEEELLPKIQEVPEPTTPEQYAYPQHLQSLRVPFAAHFAEQLDSFRSTFFEHKLQNVHHQDPRVGDLRRAMEASISEKWLSMLKEHREAYAQDLAALRLTAVPLLQKDQQLFLRPILQDEVKNRGITELHQFLWRHQGTLQLALRQLAAVPADLRDLTGLMGILHGRDQRFPENVQKMMGTITSHACAAVHPCPATLQTLGISWLWVAKRCLSAARSCLEHSEHLPVEVSALSVVTELSLKIETKNLLDFWTELAIEPIRSADQLSDLVGRTLKAAEVHLTARAQQRFQLFAHQRLLKHGVSEGVLPSVLVGSPAVATAVLVRDLVQAAALDDPNCFIGLRNPSNGGSNALKALEWLAKQAGAGAALSAVICVEIQDHGFPFLDIKRSEFLEARRISNAVDLLRSLSVGSFSLEHLSALALLRLSAQRAAVAIIEDDSLWDGLDEVLDAACRPGGEDPLGLAPLLRGTVLREVSDKVANQDILLQHGRQIQWLSASLPRPGDAPLLKGPVPMFLGGFLPEAVDAAQVISEAAGCQQNTPAFMELTEKMDDPTWRFALFAASASLLCQAEVDDAREAARGWLADHPALRSLSPLMRANREALPSEIRLQLQVAPLPLLTALHLAAAVWTAPGGVGFAGPLKQVALGRLKGFLPAMPDDEEEMILHALFDGYRTGHFGSGHTRYQCQCGFKYIVADCGQAVGTGRCPNCGRPIGGVQYADHGNRRLDAQPRQGHAGEAGYIRHAASRERRQAVRELTPLPYRALHFLMHSALLGQLFEHSGRFSGSLNLQSILEHLNADWDVMSVILESSPVAVLMDIARHLLFPTESDMSALSHLGDMSVSERKTWEKRLSQAVLEPALEPTSRADFEAQLDWGASLGDAKEALPLLLADRLAPPNLRMPAILSEQREETLHTGGESSPVPELLTMQGSILELGAGDLSFALSFARAQSGFERSADLTVTTLEHWQVVQTRYPSAAANRNELEGHGARFLDQIDGTDLQSTMPGERFDAIIFNFPYGGTFLQNVNKMKHGNGLHRALLEGVLASARSVLTSNGCVWMTLLWSQIQDWSVAALAQRNGFVLSKTESFPRSRFPYYTPVWGDDRDFERRQPWQIYAGKPAVLCCFVTPEAKRRRHAARAASAAATPAVPAATRAAPAEGAAGCRDEELKLGLGRMLRLVEKPTMNRLEREFQLSAELAVKYPLLDCALKSSEALHLAAHLAPILEFQRFLKRHLEFEVSRADANTWKLRDVLCSLRDASHSAESGEAGASHQSEAATFARNRKRFERFQSAWTACKQAGCMIRYGCKQLPEAPEMTLESPVSLCCPDETTDAGSFVLALVQSLVDRQNSFLKEVLAMASRDALGAAAAVRSVLEYWFHPGHVCLPIVGIEEVNETHLLVHSTEEDHFAWMTGFGASGALCGWEEEMQADASELLVPGARCVFDWNLLEQEVAERLLQKAVQIDFRVENFNFPFKGEAFLNDYRFLEELHERVPQELSPDEPRACLMSTVKAAGLMASLQATIAAVRRLTPEPGLSLDDFCKNWFHGSHLQELLARKEATCRGLNVQHLVHLFELVEVQAAKDLAQEAGSLPKRYCVPLPEGLPCLQNWMGSRAREIQEILLRIYIRWLTHGRLQPSEFIADYAERASRLMQPYQMDVKEIFGDLQLAHVQAALTFASNRCPTE
ncbi:unnamed protein product [Durusdinium trenchii]|uniref:RZ-type domain-containing protein n=1 Tax=Durusdinium trenchii TaxID=1381693 RepID=A0ABP0SEM2_9DINO